MNTIYRMQVWPTTLYRDDNKEIVASFEGTLIVSRIVDYLKANTDTTDTVIFNSMKMAGYITGKVPPEIVYEVYAGHYYNPDVIPDRNGAPLNIPIMPTDDYVFRFGKYKGWRYGDVEPSYQKWFITNVPPEDWLPKRRKPRVKKVKEVKTEEVIK